MATIFIKDDLRASVEAASGGKQTVLYTASGQPSFMNIIPRFTGEQVGIAGYSDFHPMFYGQDGIVRSEYFFGTYPGIVKNGELLSLPGVDVSHTLNHDQFVAYARACGAGFHAITNDAAAGVALWCRANSFQPRGNTNTGASSDAPHETGRKVTDGSGRTLTGSGPNGWRHDNSSSGISDLNGNVWEWTPGLRVVAGEIQVIPNNGMAINATNHADGSAAWKAIDGTATTLAAAFVAPGSANTVKYAVSGTAAQTLVRASGLSFEGMTSYVTGAGALLALKALGLMPVTTSGVTTGLLGGTIATPAANDDGFWVTLTGEILPIRFGGWDYAAAGGVFAVYLGSTRGHASSNIGSRLGFVL